MEFQRLNFSELISLQQDIEKRIYNIVKRYSHLEQDIYEIYNFYGLKKLRYDLDFVPEPGFRYSKHCTDKMIINPVLFDKEFGNNHFSYFKADLAEFAYYLKLYPIVFDWYELKLFSLLDGTGIEIEKPIGKQEMYFNRFNELLKEFPEKQYQELHKIIAKEMTNHFNREITPEAVKIGIHDYTKRGKKSKKIK